MAELIAWRDGAKTGAEGLGKALYYLFTDGILSSTSFSPSQRGAGANMSIDVAVGSALLDSGLSYHYPVWIDAIKNVTGITADGSNPRKTIIVYYLDLAVIGSTVHNPGALKFLAVNGTAAGSPTDPSDPTIQSAVGASNPWKKVARVNVAAGATSITNANIDDLRTASWVRPTGQFIATGSVQAGAITQMSAARTFTDSASDDGTTQTMTSGGWNDVTNLSRTVTIVGGDVAVDFTIPVDNTSSAGTSLIRVLDGATVVEKISVAPGSVGPRHVVTCHVPLTGVSPGSHTFKVQAQMLAGGGATLRLFTGQSSISVKEYKR